MKRYWLILIGYCLAVGTLMAAEHRTEREMKTIAQSQLQLGAVTRGESRALQLETILRNDELAMIGDPEAGFVVVSRDKRQKPVLAVSVLPFSANDMPDAFRWWLSQMTARLATGIPIRTRSMEAVENFVRTQWHQSDPYNGMTPKSGKSDHCPTGCVATAMAQIMKYYAYPAQGKGRGSYEVSGVTKKEDIKGVYQWDKMMDNYDKSSNAGVKNKEAVQQIMYDAGLSVDMNYGTEGSSALNSDAARAFFRNFSYDSLAVKRYMRDFFSDEEWMGMIYNELSQKRPIQYGGTDKDNKNGHAFLLTGYDSEGKLYVNWGWGSKKSSPRDPGTSYDGYFEIGDMTLGGILFSDQHEMVVGIRPQEKPDADEQYVSLWGCYGPYTANVLDKNILEFAIPTFYNLDVLYFRGNIRVIFEDQDGQKEHYDLVDTGWQRIATYYGYMPDNEGDEYVRDTMDVSDLPAGTYDVYVVSQGKTEKTPQELRTMGGLCPHLQVTKAADGTLTVTGGATAVERVRQQSPVASDQRWYDLYGRQHGADGGSLSPGVYIRDGRKYIKK